MVDLNKMGLSRVGEGVGASYGAAAPAAFPTNGTPLDTFDRGNADPLDGSWTQGWGTIGGNLKIVSNQLTWSSGGASGIGEAYWNATTFNADQEVYMDITTRVSGSQHSIRGRGANIGASIDGYQVTAFTDTNLVKAYRFDDETTAVELESISQTIADGDKIGMKLVGNTGHIWYKSGAGAWTEIGTFDASAYTGSGRIGAGLYPSGTVADNFGGGNV